MGSRVKGGRSGSRSKGSLGRAVKTSTDTINMLPTDIAMRHETVNGQRVVIVEFVQPNVTFVQPMKVDGWRQFIDDLETVMGSQPVEHKDERETTSGLTLPSSDDISKLLR